MLTNKDISVKWDASTNVSTITSPCFDKENRSPVNHGGSLFSRLSAQMTSPQIAREHDLRSKQDGGDLVIGSPTESPSNPSPIRMSDSIFEYQPHTKLDESYYKSFVADTPSKETEYRATEEIKPKLDSKDGNQSVKSNKSRRERILSLLNALESNDPVAAMNDSSCRFIDTAKQDRKPTIPETREERSITTDLNPSPVSTKAAANDKCSVNVSIDTSCHLNQDLNNSRLTQQTSSSSKRDEWREVIDVESGRKYYYNRKTRVSKWKLPKDAVLAKPKKIGEKWQPSDITKGSHIIQNSDLSLQSSNFSSDQKELNQSKLSTHERKSNAFQPSSAQNNDGCSKPFVKETQPVNDYSGDIGAFSRVNEGLGYLQTDDSALQSPTHNVSHEYTARSTQFKSPQDCGLTTSDRFFCMLCGVRCSLAALGPHLSRCSSKKDVFSRHELKKVVVDVISAIEVSPKLSEASDDHSRDMNCTAYLDSDINESQGWETTVEEELISYERGISDSIKQKCQHKNIEEFSEIEVKTCPFCRDEFSKGNHFSGHLLKCPERKKGRNRRRAKKKESQDISCPRTLVERKRHTPGRKLPWE